LLSLALHRLMKTRILIPFLLAGLVPAFSAVAAETKTDLARDVFVENSTTNFVVTASPPHQAGKATVAFDISVPTPGSFKLVCFVDGKPAKPVEFTAPGTFVLTTRGLAPGEYRVTLQLIDRQGGVGGITTTLRVQ
jgi:hypothetical protein